jgi:hypothetical protein
MPNEGNRPSDLEQTLRAVSEALAAPALDPDPARADWAAERATLSRLKEQVEGVFQELAAPDGDAALSGLHSLAVTVGSELAAVLAAAGRDGEAQSLLRSAESFASTDEREVCRAGRSDLPSFVQLCRAMWLAGQNRSRESERLLRRLARSCENATLQRQARWLLDTPRPITSAPSLFTLNGIGFRLWGDRDRHDDHSYIATWGLVFLFIPVLPVRAYRVVRQGNRYLFLGRVPLGPFARAARTVVALALLVATVGGGGWAWWDGADHRATQALAAAASIERRGAREEATAAYERAAQEFSGKASARLSGRAGAGVVRCGLAALPSPLGETQVDMVARLVRRYGALPGEARTRDASLALADGLSGQAQAMGDATPARAEASLRLLDLAHDLGPDAAQRVAGARSTLRQHRIRALATDWPLDALALAADSVDDPAVVALAEPVLVDLAHSPSLLLDAQPDVEALLRAAQGSGETPERLVPVRAALARAVGWRDDKERAHALQEGDREALRRRLTAHPDDQEVALALATSDYSHGDVDAAARRIRTLGPPGHTIGDAQRFGASLLAGRGQLAEAEAILAPHVAARLPRFAKAAQAYDEARDERAKALFAQLQRGPLPKEIEEAGEDHTRQLEAARAWVTSRLDADAQLTQLKDAYLHHAAVAPAVLALGRIRLEQARAASASARGPLLAEAERLFLAIRAEAEGQPGFHLALGQVYHRLGRSAEGDAELGKLLDGPAVQKLAVAEVYRDLGLGPKAIDIVEKVYNSDGDQATKYRAAYLRALLAVGFDEREKWLKLGDPSADPIVLDLKELQAERAFLAGHDQEAARLYAESAARREREALHNPVAANNAALAHQSRFMCTGDLKDLERAARLLENAYRAQSDVALVASNLSRTLTYFGMLRVIGRFAPVATLRPSGEQAERLLSSLLEGDKRAAVLAATRAEPLLARAGQVERQSEVLSPQWVDLYEQELDLADLTDDDNAIAQLDARLKAQPTLDTDTGARNFERFVAGEFHDQRIRQLDADLARTQKLLDEARQKSDTRAEGFALLLRGDAFLRRGVETGKKEDLVESEHALREAQRLVPEMARNDLAWTLMALAMAHAAEADSDFARFWEKTRRLYSGEAQLLAMRQGDGGAARVAALRRQPEIGEATKLLREDTQHQPGIGFLILARIAGDDALAAREAAALSHPRNVAARRMRARLHPEQIGPSLVVKFVEAGGT